MNKPKRWHQYVGIRAAFIGTLGLIFIATMNILYNRSRLVQDNKQYKQDLGKKDFEIQRLETQLVPFKTIALEKYTGSEQEALNKLAKELEDLKNYVNPFKKPIATAMAHVEVTIIGSVPLPTKPSITFHRSVKSDERDSVLYPIQGGHLAFVKNRQPLLSMVATQSVARQNEKGEVVWIGDFSVQAGCLAIGEPIEVLQTSDYIQIMFSQIPQNSQVLKGQASIVINGNIRFKFEIFPQQMQGNNIVIQDTKSKFSNK